MVFWAAAFLSQRVCRCSETDDAAAVFLPPNSHWTPPWCADGFRRSGRGRRAGAGLEGVAPASIALMSAGQRPFTSTLRIAKAGVSSSIRVMRLAVPHQGELPGAVAPDGDVGAGPKLGAEPLRGEAKDRACERRPIDDTDGVTMIWSNVFSLGWRGAGERGASGVRPGRWAS